MNWYNACDVLDLLHNELDKEVSKGYRWNKIVNVLIIIKGGTNISHSFTILSTFVVEIFHKKKF